MLHSECESIAKRGAGGEREAIDPEMMHSLALTRPEREQWISSEVARRLQHGQPLRLGERAAQRSQTGSTPQSSPIDSERPQLVDQDLKTVLNSGDPARLRWHHFTGLMARYHLWHPAGQAQDCAHPPSHRFNAMSSTHTPDPSCVSVSHEGPVTVLSMNHAPHNLLGLTLMGGIRAGLAAAHAAGARAVLLKSSLRALLRRGRHVTVQ